MEERALIFILCITCVSQAVDYCPKNASMWKEREASFRINCGRNKFYHCLRDENHGVEESCRERSWVQPGFCPEFNSVANEIDVFLCKESMGKCPIATYWSNELYRYSACLKALNAVKEQVVANAKKTSSGTMQNTKGGRDVIMIIIISSSVVSVLAFVTVIIVIIKFCRRTRTSNTTKHKRKDKGLEEEGGAGQNAMDHLISYQDKSNVATNSDTAKKMQESYTEQKIYSKEERTIEALDSRSGDEKCIPQERTAMLIDQKLRDPGNVLLLIVQLQSDVDSLVSELCSKEPGFLKIENFDDWSKTSGKEGYYVLLQCVINEYRRGSLKKYVGDLSNIASDIKTSKLRAIIPIRSDMTKDDKQAVLSHDLFRNLEPIEL